MFDNCNDILTVYELQELLFISRNTAYKLLKTGRINNSFKIGNSWRIPRFAVEEYVGYKPKQERFNV